MNKNGSTLKERKSFIKTGVNDPTKAANRLKRLAGKLKKATTMREKARILSEILYLSEDTIYRDSVS
ncbi:MAG TPA: hypothetical protein ENH82_15505 [bacterium]|nr:hypothetical protein [bacterium]